MKVKFDKIPCKDIDGNVVQLNLSKVIANFLYNNAPTADIHELAMKINRNEDLELNQDMMTLFKNMIPQMNTVAYFARQGLEKWLDAMCLEPQCTEQ